MESKLKVISVTFVLAIVFGCSSTSKIDNPSTITDKTDWQLPSETSGTLRADRASTFSVSDGLILVSLTIPPASVAMEQHITVSLTNEDKGHRLQFDPPLALLEYANIIIIPRTTNSALFPIAHSGDQYKPVRYQKQSKITSAWLKLADSLWIGNASEAQSIAKNLMPPEGIDCSTVSGLDDIGSILALGHLQQELGYDVATPGILEAVSRRAAAELNRILNNDDVPVESCGYYLASLMELGRIVGDIGLVDVTVDTNRLRGRIDEVLQQCPLEYELVLNYTNNYKDGHTNWWSREPIQGILGKIHDSPFFLDGIMSLSSVEDIIGKVDGSTRLKGEFDLTDPFNPRTILTREGAKIRMSALNKDGIIFEFDNTSDENKVNFSFGLPTYVAGTVNTAGGDIQGEVVIAGLGTIKVDVPKDDDLYKESYIFELRHHTRTVINYASDEMVWAITGVLTIPKLEDVDFITKQICESALASP